MTSNIPYLISSIFRLGDAWLNYQDRAGNLEKCFDLHQHTPEIFSSGFVVVLDQGHYFLHLNLAFSNFIIDYCNVGTYKRVLWHRSLVIRDFF